MMDLPIYHRLIDIWDEKQARHGESVKSDAKFELDADLAFDTKGLECNLAEFCLLSGSATTDPAFFDGPARNQERFVLTGDLLRFRSRISTKTAENNTVWVQLTRQSDRGQAVVVFHHWNADTRSRQIASFLVRQGIAVAEIAMPYHFERSRPGSRYADYMLSPNLGLTLQSMKQAVSDGLDLVRWLSLQGYEKIGVFGTSLGSWVAGLVAAQEEAVSKAALFLVGGSLADMVWSGRATRNIRSSLEPCIALDDLRRAWGPLDLCNSASRLARAGLKIQMVLADRDRVVLPEISERLVESLKAAGTLPEIHALNCGHYSFALPPYALRAGLHLRSFLD